MNFNKHFDLVGQHAFLGASKYHWINYDEEKVANSYFSFLAIQKGTELHDLARRLIENGIKLPKSSKTLNMYVNDAIGYHMVPEQVLRYSDNCFGTTDAISSLDSIIKTKVLRIHDYKSGTMPAHREQLEIYTALFCLEYRMKPSDLDIQLRIYQSDAIDAWTPDVDDILAITEKIIAFDKIIDRIKFEEE